MPLYAKIGNFRIFLECGHSHSKIGDCLETLRTEEPENFKNLSWNRKWNQNWTRGNPASSLTHIGA